MDRNVATRIKTAKQINKIYPHGGWSTAYFFYPKICIIYIKWERPFILTHIFIIQSSLWALAKLHFYSGSQLLWSYKLWNHILFFLNLNGKPRRAPSRNLRHLEIFVSWAWPIKFNFVLKEGAFESDRLNGLVNKQASGAANTLQLWSVWTTNWLQFIAPSS